MKVNFSIPASIIEFKNEENELYSKARLKIFHTGMTGDKRLFTETFAKKLLKSLPYVPVVGYFDSEKGDFEGHKQEVQYIYGIVPAEPNLDYEKENGLTYAVCDIILYTGRLDETGTVAKKIVGKPHSLELNPSSVKYRVNNDANGEFKNIEFLEGKLLGLSVLGDDENPAFKGSAFFKENEEFKQIFSEIVEYVKTLDAEQKRGVEMNELEQVIETPQNVENLEPQTQTNEEQFTTEDNVQEIAPVVEETPEVDFATKYMEMYFSALKSDSELHSAIHTALVNSFGDCYPVQFFSTESVVVFYSFEDGEYYRVDYILSEEENSITFGEPVKVKVRYLTDEEINSTFTEVKPDEAVIDESAEGTKTEQGVFSKEENTDGEIDEENTKEEPEAFAENNDTIALSSREREEFEALKNEVSGFRRERKEGIINSFKGELSDEVIASATQRIEELSLDEIEAFLYMELGKASKGEKNKQKAPYILGVTGQPKPKTFEERIRESVEYYKEVK